MKTLMLLTALLSGCIPVESKSQAVTQAPTTLNTEALLNTVLTLDSLQATFTADENFLMGQAISLNNGYAKGKIKLLSSMVLAVPDSYLILPVEGNLVLGSGVYLLLLQKQTGGYLQTHEVYLGLGLNLFSLEYADGKVTSVTVDSRSGRPPLNPPRGGQQVFRIIDGKLVEL